MSFQLRGHSGEPACRNSDSLHWYALRVENILTGRSEQEKVLVSNPDFMILPDMKWDLKTISSLYLVAIAQDRTIRSLRDLRKKHLHLLKNIRDESERVVRQKWGLGKGSLRMFVHYQPSYCALSILFQAFPNFYSCLRSLSYAHRQCKLRRASWNVRRSSSLTWRYYITGQPTSDLVKFKLIKCL
jgi:hypothetical protein